MLILKFNAKPMQLTKLGLTVFFLSFMIGTNAQKKPNIVIIVSDDHAYQSIGAYGSRLMQTPNIDRIAREGIVFKKAYVTNSLCGPSRAVLLTGKYSNKNGFKDNDHSSFDGSQYTFIKDLTKNSYETAWVGKWHLETKPQGFTYWQVLPGQGQYYNPEFIVMDGTIKKTVGYVTNIIEDAAEDWLNNRDTAKPFCLVIGHKATHRTWMPDTCDLGRFDKVTFPLPHDFYDTYTGRPAAQVQDMTIAKTMTMDYDLKMFESEEAESKETSINRMNAAQRARFDSYYRPIDVELQLAHLTGTALTEWKYQRYLRDYLSTAVSLDRNIGRTLDYLDKHQLTGNTIVIYMSDQGFYLGEHGWFDKRWIYEESFRTPMMIRYPALIKPGMLNNDFVMNLDIAPTVLEAAGLPVPKEIQGKSFFPILAGKSIRGRDAMYYHYYENGEHSVSPHFGIRTKRYKLIRFYTRVTGWELYDLQNDPHELQNLYGEKGYEQITLTLKSKLEKLIDKYEDADAKLILKKETLPSNLKKTRKD
jgi:arylsulfatase A-like enzyme